MADLTERAMLVYLSIRRWQARKIDRKITDETHARYHAAADSGAYDVGGGAAGLFRVRVAP